MLVPCHTGFCHCVANLQAHLLSGPFLERDELGQIIPQCADFSALFDASYRRRKRSFFLLVFRLPVDLLFDVPDFFLLRCLLLQILLDFQTVRSPLLFVLRSFAVLRFGCDPAQPAIGCQAAVTGSQQCRGLATLLAVAVPPVRCYRPPQDPQEPAAAIFTTEQPIVLPTENTRG